MKNVLNYDEYINESNSNEIVIVGKPSKETVVINEEQLYKLRKTGLIKFADADYKNLGTQRGYYYNDTDKKEILKLIK